jgi:hypothetical protein
LEAAPRVLPYSSLIFFFSAPSYPFLIFSTI